MIRGSSLARCLLALAFATSNLYAQAQLDWLRTHDGVTGAWIDNAGAAAVDASGNVYLAIESYTPAIDSDVALVKFSASGVKQWSRTFDSGLGPNDRPTDIAIASNGDVCFCGNSDNGPSRLFVVRYDPSGNLLWSVVSNSAFNDRADALAFDAAGNVIIGGVAAQPNGNYDMLVRAYTPAGQVLNETLIDGPQHGGDAAYALIIDNAGNIFVGGMLDQTATRNGGIAKLNSGLQFQWLTQVSGQVGLTEYFRHLASDGQGGVVASGVGEIQIMFQKFENALTTRCNASSGVVWTRHYPQFGGPEYDFAQDVAVDPLGVTWVLCATNLFGVPKIVLQRFDPAGTLLSTSSYDGQTHAGAMPGGLVQGSAGQVFLAGFEGSTFGSPTDEAVLMQFDGSGAVNWNRRFQGAGFGLDAGGLELAPNGRLVAWGTTKRALPSQDSDGFALQIDVNQSPQTYCSAKVNSLGCTPRATFTGLSSAAASSGFQLRVDQVRNRKVGLLLYGSSGRAAVPFGGGLLCIAPVIRRTIGLSSGGSALPANDCSGVWAIDMNAFAHGNLGGNPDPALLSQGMTIDVQAWGRDPGFAPPNNVSLSAALEYAVLP